MFFRITIRTNTRFELVNQQSETVSLRILLAPPNSNEETPELTEWQSRGGSRRETRFRKRAGRRSGINGYIFYDLLISAES